MLPRGADESAERIEHEFSMLGQPDFAGIDAYVKRHGLNDESKGEQRRAKRLNINKPKADRSEDRDEAEASELKKAGREAEMKADEDDDEEDDENFDPGSEGESEGSGTSSEEEDNGRGGRAQSGDLIADELGIEAEEVMEEDEAT